MDDLYTPTRQLPDDPPKSISNFDYDRKVRTHSLEIAAIACQHRIGTCAVSSTRSKILLDMARDIEQYIRKGRGTKSRY